MNNDNEQLDEAQETNNIIDPSSHFKRQETTHPFTRHNLSTLKGRMNRLDFVILMFSSILFFSLIYKLMGINPFSLSAQAMLDPNNLPDSFQATITLSTISLVIFALISVKRLHDIDYSGWVAAVFIVPLLIGGFIGGVAIFVGFILRLILMFAKGLPDPNKFGDIPVGNNRNKVLVLVVVLFLIFTVYSGFIEEATPYLDQLRDFILEQSQG